MTQTQHRDVPELVGELREIDTQLDGLFARRAQVVLRLQAIAPTGTPVPLAASAPGASVQQLLLTTGAVLVGLAGLFFAAVAWALVGPGGRFGILLVLGVLLGAVASWTRPRLGGAAGAIAAVSASLVATAGYAGPALWDVSWSGTGLAAYAAVVSAVLCAAYTLVALASGIRTWTVAATLAAAVGVVAAGVATASATEDALGYTAATAVLSVVVALAGRLVRDHRAWWAVTAVAGGTSVASLLVWAFTSDRAVPYAVATLGWAVLVLAARRLVPAVPAVPAVVAHTLAAALGAAALGLLVGTQPWGAPSLPLAALAVLLAVAVSYLRTVPVAPGVAATAVLGATSVLVPAVHGALSDSGSWVAWLLLAAVAAGAAGASPRRTLDATARGLLWWSAGTAAGLAWLVHLDDSLTLAPVERVALPVGALLLLAGVGWAVAVRRTGAGWLPTTATLLPGLLAALLPGALSSLALSWDAGWSDALLRTLVYTGVGASLAVIGAQLRVAALLVAGEVVVAICVLAHLVAATQVVPQWVVLAGTGAVLLAVGARWEWLRTRGAAAAGWVGRLR